MAKTIATFLGIGFLLVGILGFVMPDLMGMHLSPAHSVVHLLTGAVSLFFGLKGTLGGARGFCLAFGAVYVLLGIAGFILGKSGTPGVAGPADDRLFKVLPGILELGTMDHIVHVLLGGIYLVGGLMTKNVVTTTSRDARV